MLSAWSDRALALPGRLRPPAGTWPLVGFVFLLILCLGNSTVDAAWVPGTGGLTLLALVAALFMGVLALIKPLPWWAALLIGAVLAPVAAFGVTHGALARAHPNDPTDLGGLLNAWLGRIASGDAFNDTNFYAYLLYLLFWVVGGWLAWCSLRWRQPLLGLVPGAAAFATNVLNFPDNQNGYVVAFLVLTLGVLLWTSYMRQLSSASRRRVRLSSDARWDFWESGVVVMAGVIALGLVLPQLSYADKTVDIENGSFRGWAELEQHLNHPVAFGTGTSSGSSIGFASLAQLAGPQHKTGGVVLTYSLEGTFSGIRYFRGYNLESTSTTGQGGPSWRYTDAGAVSKPITKGVDVPYAETYQAEGGGAVKINMLKPPSAAQDVLFYPGTLLKVDRNAVGHSSVGNQAPAGNVPADALATLDRLTGQGRPGGSGTYTVTIEYSTATVDMLENAGTDYPVWVDPYRNFGNFYQAAPSPISGTAYRSRATMLRIQDLARRVTQGASNPYDQATAIESYLRSNYKYTLTPTVPPRDVDPLEYFLFTSKEGYCEYFASAMGDMLRSLGIPVRLVNGYGPGQFDEHLGRYVVRESDAHTWVEAYFPNYGWIPFEPTPDGVYFPITRGITGASCAPDSEFCGVGDNGAATAGDTATKPDKGNLDQGDTGLLGSGRLGRAPVPGGFAGLVLGLIAVGLAIWLAARRYLRPRSVSAVWHRVSLLSRLAGVPAAAGDTPMEFGSRLARAIPEAAVPARALAERFAVAAYAPREQALGARSPVLTAWDELRPLLLRRARGRVRITNF
jgi:hypothetical protein